MNSVPFLKKICVVFLNDHDLTLSTGILTFFTEVGVLLLTCVIEETVLIFWLHFFHSSDTFMCHFHDHSITVSLVTKVCSILVGYFSCELDFRHGWNNT